MSSVGSSGMKPLHRMPTPDEHDQQLRNVANLYEKQFLREMVKAMRTTVTESELIPTSQGEKIFREQLDNEYAEKWGDKGGIGLSNLIYTQLIDRFGPALGITKIDKPMGPMKLPQNPAAVAQASSGQEAPTQAPRVNFPSPNKIALEILRPHMLSDEAQEVTNPWSGILSDRKEVGTDLTLMEVFHDNGLKSQFSFRGQSLGLELGSRVEAGETLGRLTPDAKSLWWNISL